MNERLEKTKKYLDGVRDYYHKTIKEYTAREQEIVELLKELAHEAEGRETKK